MSLEVNRKHWERFGETDAMWAIVTDESKKGNRWEAADFFRSGDETVTQSLEFVKQCGAEIHFGRALDFGCGVGRLTQALARRFESVVGVDVAEPMIRQARSLNQFPDTCEYRVNTTDDLAQLDSDQFDFILSIIVLQHIPPVHTLRYLAEFMRVLKPGGILMFQQTASKRFWHRHSQPPATFKHRVARMLPVPLMAAYAEIKMIGSDRPRMDAYGIKPSVIISHLARHGGEVLKIAPDDWGGPAWSSNHYCVRKKVAR